MRTNKAAWSLIVITLLVLTLGSSFADGKDKDKNKGDEAKGEGVITLKSGDTLTVETSSGTVAVTISPQTKIQHPVGLFRKKDVGPEVLIPGLKMKFEGTGDEKQVKADSITFEQDDLTLAKVIQAGVNPVAQQAEANKQRIAANQTNMEQIARATSQRFSELGQFEVKDQATILFASGDFNLSDESKQTIAAFAKEALEGAKKDYLIQVDGFADSVGTAEDNQVLSKNRAEAVVAYLIQDCSIPVGRIVAPGAMSEADPVASNETASGRAENRRAEMKLLINKGIAGND